MRVAVRSGSAARGVGGRALGRRAGTRPPSRGARPNPIAESLEGRIVLSGYVLNALTSFSPPPNGYWGARSALTEDTAGDLFGTTADGGAKHAGTVYEIVHGSGAVVTVGTFTGANGSSPVGGVALDASGHLFGVTNYGGANGIGTVYEIAAGGNGVTTLASFDRTNGAYPMGAVVFDASGNLFGTSEAGGANDEGTLFEIARGSHTLTTLASFDDANGGGTYPYAGPTLDASGNLFGTTHSGGANKYGTVFELAEGSGAVTTLASFVSTGVSTPSGGVVVDPSGNVFGAVGVSSSSTPHRGVYEVARGSGVVTTLTAFTSDNGYSPNDVLALDAAGNLFGTTDSGGSDNSGTAFEIARGSNVVTTLVTFTRPDALPEAGVLLDAAGNLFGATRDGGDHNYGEVFQISPGSPALTTVASFAATGANSPTTGLTRDAAGNLYGVTEDGGDQNDGALYEIARGTNTLTTLASFDKASGGYPEAGVTVDASGNVFGTTVAWGPGGVGTVYEVARGSNAVTVLASFDGGLNGRKPASPPVLDASGNLFGTTGYGGLTLQGNVFEVARGSGAVTNLASFNGTNGAVPQGGLAVDAAGDLYGATYQGGAANNGTVFEFSRADNTINSLASFNKTNGRMPRCGVVSDAAGNLFGGTDYGGANDLGTVFTLPHGSGAITALVSFGFPEYGPVGGLALDASGNLFGTSRTRVFEVAGASSGGSGSKTLTTLTGFNATTGSDPALFGGVVMDAAGNLFGVTHTGGAGNAGGVFEAYQPARLSFLKPPGPATAGVALYPAVTAAVLDSAGNAIAADNSTVTLTLTGGTFAGGGTTATAPAVAGVATFDNLVINSPGNYTLTATDGAYSMTTAPATFTVSAPPTAQSIALSDGSTTSGQSQRSRIRRWIVTFASPTTLSPSQLSLALLNTGGSGRNDGSAPTPLAGALGTPANPSGDGKTWVVPVVAGTTYADAGGLADGVYTLTLGGVSGAGVTSLTFHCLFGDTDGNKTVNALDYAKLKNAFGTGTGSSGYNADLDFDHNGSINALDYAQFKKRFGLTFSY